MKWLKKLIDWIMRILFTYKKAQVKYGLLYNWWTVSGTGDASLAPTGWRVPTDDDFWALCIYLDPDATWITNDAGKYLKETGTTYWDSPNTGATNSTGFNGRGAGERHYTTSAFQSLKATLRLWNFESTGNNGLITYLSYDSTKMTTTEPGVVQLSLDKNYGCSVRLVKESTTLSDGGTSIMTDNDGNRYDTICIGTQEWMLSNLKTTKYRNGDAIPEVTDDTAWAALSSGAWCYYNNDPSYM